MQNLRVLLHQNRVLLIIRAMAVATLIALAMTTSSSPNAHADLGQGGGIPETWMILPVMHAENVLLKFVLASYGKPDAERIQAIKDAEAVVSRFATQKRMIHRLETMKDLADVKSLFFPTFSSVIDEAEFRRTSPPPPFFVLSTGSVEVQDALASILATQEKKLAHYGRLYNVLSNSGWMTSARRLLLSEIDQQHLINSKWNPGISDDARLALSDRIQKEIAVGIQQIENTGAIIAKSGALKHADPGMQRFFELAIGEYFRHLDTGAKLEIVSAFLENPNDEDPLKRFETMILNSGPQFQKLFQVYARQDGFDENMKEIFKSLESNTKPAPFRLIEQEIKSLRNLPFKFISIDAKRLGGGTMAQVHRAVIQMPDGEIRQVAVRVMKPDIRERLLSDNAVLRKIAPLIDADPILQKALFPQITPVVSEIIAMGMNELNVPQTAAAQRRAPEVYNRDVNASGLKLRFHVPAVYDVGDKAMTMVMEFTPGTSFEKFSLKRPRAAQIAVAELTKLWVEEALLGSGFFHADLHQGNLLVGASEDGRVQVNLVDYGMTGQLTPEMQSKIIALSVVLTSRNADIMAEAMWDLSMKNENKTTLAALKKLFTEELARPQSHSYTFGSWVSNAATAGVKFPAEFTTLNRGITLVTQMMTNQGLSADFSDVIRARLLRDPAQLRRVLTSLDSVSARDWLRVAWARVRPEAVTAPHGPLTCQALFARH